MKISVSQKILNEYPKINVGILVAKGIVNTGEDDKIFHLLEEIEELLRLEFNGNTDKLINPARVTKEDLKINPIHYKSNVRKLMQKALKNGNKNQNRFLNMQNFLALKYIIPIGSDDLNSISGNVKIDIVDEKVVYKDSKKILSSEWNYSQNPDTKVNKKTKNIIMYFDALMPVRKTQLAKVMKETISMLKSFFNAEYIEGGIMNEEYPEFNIK